MKLKITCFEMIGGNHYTVIPLEDNYPKELAELGGSKMIEVSEEKGKEILERQAVGIKLQCELALIHSGQMNVQG